MSEVRVGQVWESEDPRDDHRRVEVMDIRFGMSSSFYDLAVCRNLKTGVLTKIMVRRLRHTGRRGWRLVKEAK